jgi:hypothetical protein
MDQAHEVQEIEDICTRLGERFPQLGADVIQATVRLAHTELAGGIRDYVPVLVEHNARDRLEAIADREDPAPPGSTSSQGTQPTA